MVQPLTVEDLRRSDAEDQVAPPLSTDQLATLDEIQRRILWLSTMIVHHANNVRPSADGLKVGGHQASSASVVSIMTALYFHALQAGDRVSIKPHASPVFHAVQYLLGNLSRDYLTELRAYKGLQSYPSRTKDPDPVDFSTGSVGLGAVAPNFAALGHLYAERHFGDVSSRRFISLVGDAELDEGNVWEAMIEDALKHVNNVLWIVDLNRQSLDRVIPGIRAAELKTHFANSGWRVLEAKYGRELRAAFARPGGEALRQAIDDMENEEYQGLIRLDGSELRERIIQRDESKSEKIAQVLADVPDELLPNLISNLGGHDLQDLIDVLDEGLRQPADKPAIIFAYTIKGWHMPFYGDALNHSALLNANQIETFRDALDIAGDDDWALFDPDSAAGKLCLNARERIYDSAEDVEPQVKAEQIPTHIGHNRLPKTSTQESFGRLLTQLADIEDVGERIITTSPDVSISTNLGGWINKVGVFRPDPATIYFNAPRQLLRWEPGPEGQHIELGISEMNLFMFLGALGLSQELSGQLLFPIGTVYDPFICRGLDALVYGCYSGSKFVFAGTPAGISLAPEGGAHQSTITPSIGHELPNLRSHEPAFAQELEWQLLDGIQQCTDRKHGKSTYVRLSTKPIDQKLMEPALERFERDELRRQVLLGGYRLIDAHVDAPDADTRDTVQIIASGVMIPEAVAAARLLHEEGIAANVINLTSPQLAYEGWANWRRSQMGLIDTDGEGFHLQTLIPAAERQAPIVTVQDGASHSLAWLGSVYGAPLFSLGVDEFGQSGDIPSLYKHYEIDADAIAEAAFSQLDLRDGV